MLFLANFPSCHVRPIVKTGHRGETVHFEIDRADPRTHRLNDIVAPTDLSEGQLVLRIEKFALTSNNVSYVMSGDLLDYWGFFPTDAGWGRLPVMGFGIVAQSAHTDIEIGSRFFGFYPAADFHVVQATPTRGGFVDNSPHRETHAMAYRTFDRADPTLTDQDESYYLLLRGLFVTSFLAEDFIAENKMFGATQVLVTSASSKTSLALAHVLKTNNHGHIVGLTSAANVDFTVATGLYDEVITYNDIETLDKKRVSVLVDMAGSADVINRVHNHFDGTLGYSCRVGFTHWEEGGSTKAAPGPKPEFFFAPTQLAKRGKEWGREDLNTKISTALALFIQDAHEWLHISEGKGADAVSRVYDELMNGSVDPSAGHVLSM